MVHSQFSHFNAPADLPVTLPIHFCLVAIGASAGGLQAISLILAALPADFPIPIIIVQHLSPDFRSQIASILSRRTALHVKEAEEGDALQAGWVYVAPPAKHVFVCPNQTLSLMETEKVHHSRPSVDVLFKSIAENIGECSIGVILTGGDGDGATGIQAIKASGGVTIAQDEASSEHPSMPRSAVETGDVDFVLPLTDIAPALLTLTGSEKSPEPAVGRGSALTSGNESREGHSSRDAITDVKDTAIKDTGIKDIEKGRTRRAGVLELLTRRKAAAETMPTSSALLEKAVADLAACSEALQVTEEVLRVTEEALRVQSGVIISYMLALRDDV